MGCYALVFSTRMQAYNRASVSRVPCPKIQRAAVSTKGGRMLAASGVPLELTKQVVLDPLEDC